MQLTLRPYVTAGVALTGAGLIAVTPVAPPPLDIQTRDVQLSATGELPNLGELLAAPAGQEFPITTPVGLFNDTVTNLQGLGSEFLQNPFPIMSQIGTNWMGYAQDDLAPAFQTAGNAMVTAVQDLPTVLQTAATDVQSGQPDGVFDAVTSIWQYLLDTPLNVERPLLAGVSEVVRGMVGNFNNVIQDQQSFFEPLIGIPIGPANPAPLWLLDLISAPLYAPNAAVTAVAGVGQDIANAVGSGDYTTALTDVAYAPSTIADAFLNGYPVDEIRERAAELSLQPIFGLNPAWGLLTNSTTGIGNLLPGADIAPDAVRRAAAGFFENILAARADIAGHLAPRVRGFAEAAAMLDTHNGPLATLLNGAGPVTLTDLHTALADLSALLNPSTALADIAALFDPSAATDIGALLGTDLAPNLSGVLLDLF